jgi:saccharopine dehydrogenase (NAD+, L-lysine-forming)
MPAGAAALRAAGFRVTVEHSSQRAIPIAAYRDAGCALAPEGAWRTAPADAIVFGLKELPDDGTPLVHRHILFGHAYKGQPGAARLLARFRAGGGVLYDLESLVDGAGTRIAAFGHWAGFAGAAVALLALAAQRAGRPMPALRRFADAGAMLASVRGALGPARPAVLVVGALGRTGRGACAAVSDLGLPLTRWDKAETARGAPFPEALEHPVLLNCILAAPGAPVLVPADAAGRPRALRVIGDIACDPGAPHSPLPLHDRTTTWAAPVLRLHADPPLDVTAIDNLPALLPQESSADYAADLLPALCALDRIDSGLWARARAAFDRHAPPA